MVVEADLQQGQSPLAKISLLTLLVLIISTGHYSTPLSWTPIHDVLRRLYYAPIFLAAYWFGKRGSLSVALGTSLLYFPHIFFQWEAHDHSQHSHEGHLNKYIECLIYLLFGLLFGTLIDQLRNVSSELRNALGQLKASFEATRTASRLAALGQLSAGLAHEIRNPLAGIRSSLDILETEPQDQSNDTRKEFLELARQEVQRADRLLGEFLKFAKPSRPEYTPVIPHELIDSVLKLIEPGAHKLEIQFRRNYKQDQEAITADGDQIKQVILNLLLNALQSSSRGGEIIIETELKNEHFSLHITDNGPGIPIEHRERIFDPFFTTREKGVGLGLSICHQIIQNHRGTLTLESHKTLSGASFKIQIPRAPGAPQQ
jgi:signal transduction histidine kinase